MVAAGSGQKLCICLGRPMAMAAGKVQADLPGCQAAIFVELADDFWIDGNHVGSHISHEALGIAGSILDQMGHMAIGAPDFISNM